MTQSRTPVPTPGELHGALTIFDARRPLEWSDEFAKRYGALTDNLGALASELGVKIDIPEERPAHLAIVSSATLREVRRRTGNGDFSRQVLTALKEASQDMPSAVAAHIKLIGLPSPSADGSTETSTFGLRVAGLADEQRSLLDVVAEVAEVEIETPSLQIDVATMRSSDWGEHSRAIMNGLDRGILHQPFTLGRLVTPTHIGTA